MAGLAISDSNPGGNGNRRLWFGRTDDDASTVSLMDASGKKRIVMRVTPDGVASISFLDAEGKVVNSMGNESKTPTPQK